MKSFEVPLVDCDIHPYATNDLPLAPHIPADFRQAVAQGQASQPGAGYQNPFGVKRRDASCGHPADVTEGLFDRYGIAYGVLQPPGISVSLSQNIDVGAAVARAWNDWQIEHWLAYDERILGSVCLNMNDPAQAAGEIRRAGAHPQMVQTIVTGESVMLYGHRHYYPIYEACAEMSLPFAIHPGHEGARTPSTPNGAPSSYFEWHSTLPITYMAHLASLVCEGVFEKFPTLKVVMVEGGFGWLPHLMWRLDKNFKALRSTTPWLRRLPSEYIVENVRLTTQPIEEPRKSEHLLQMFDMIEAQQTLCFASDYPHWDFDDPRRVFPSRMDKTLKERIFYRNAAEMYGLPTLEAKMATWNPLARCKGNGGGEMREAENLPGINNGYGTENAALDYAFAVADAAQPPVAKRGKRITIGPASEIGVGQRRIIEADGLSIGVYNIAGKFYAIKNVCPHAGAPLCQGHIQTTHRPSAVGEFDPALEGRVLRCPWHGWEFDIVTGKALYDRDSRVATYGVEVEDEGTLVVVL